MYKLFQMNYNDELQQQCIFIIDKIQIRDKLNNEYTLKLTNHQNYYDTDDDCNFSVPFLMFSKFGDIIGDFT